MSFPNAPRQRHSGISLIGNLKFGKIDLRMNLMMLCAGFVGRDESPRIYSKALSKAKGCRFGNLAFAAQDFGNRSLVTNFR